MATCPPILVAEDDENDIFFLRHALQKAQIPNSVVVAHDGQEAIDYLAGNKEYSDRAQHPTPGLLLLDLKMPKVDGFDVLSWIASQPSSPKCPVVVLSSSCHDADKERAQRLGAAAYHTKPTEFLHLVDLVRDLSSRWLNPRRAQTEQA